MISNSVIFDADWLALGVGVGGLAFVGVLDRSISISLFENLFVLLLRPLFYFVRMFIWALRVTLYSTLLNVLSQSRHIFISRNFSFNSTSLALIYFCSSILEPSLSKARSQIHFEQKMRPHLRQ